MSVIESLDAIKAQFQNGEHEDALAAVDAYLEQYNDDLDARLLKAEICLKLDTLPGYVGQTLVDLEPDLGDSLAFRVLQSRVEQTVSRKMQDGRAQLRRSRATALTCFETACQLAPRDPAVPLAAARVLALQQDDDDDDEIPELLRQFRVVRAAVEHQAVQPAPISEPFPAVEGFLRLALDRSTRGDGIYQQADHMLAEVWLERDKHAQVVDWLTHCPYPPESVSDIRDKLVSRLWGDVDRAVKALMRARAFDDADALLTLWEGALTDSPRLCLRRAELLHLLGRDADALEAYQRVLTATMPEIPHAATLDAWKQAGTYQVTCPGCGKPNPAMKERCQLCAHTLDAHDTVTSQYPDLDDESATIIAHVALAELLPPDRQHEQILHLQAAHKAIGAYNQRGLRDRITDRLKALALTEADSPRVEIPAAVHTREITPEVIDDLRQIAPDVWQTVPAAARAALLRRLIKAGAIPDARDLFERVFADKPGLASARRVRAEIDAALQAHVADLRQAAEDALRQEHTARAAQLSGDLLTLDPLDVSARLLRARANTANGAFAEVLDDLHHVILTASSDRIVREARLAAARTMERLWQVAPALEMLDGLPGAEADALRQRLDLRQRHEPYILTEDASDLVMVDTLASLPDQPHVRGYFAVTVRAVGRPWKTSWEGWRDFVLGAGYAFVEIMGGLRDAPGDPVFALRLISDPNPHIPERGALTLALLVRAVADDHESCRETTLELWHALRDILPGTQEQVYSFDPVVDPDELTRLRTPFDIVQAAEIARREEVPVASGDAYTVYPFTFGALDLHALCWTLLRQRAPAMVSIHLQPTSLMAWEQSAVDRMMLDNAAQRQASADDLTGMRQTDPVTQWWQFAPGMGRAQTNRRLLESLRTGAYALSVLVASSGSTPLLAERVASVMFGTARPVEVGFSGGYQIERARTPAERAVLIRNLTSIDVERWGFSAAPEGVPRLRQLVSEFEAAAAFRLPIPAMDGLPGVPVIGARPVAPPAGLPLDGVQWGESVIRVNGAALKITQGADDRRRHCYIVGRTGSGKTNLIKNLVLQDMLAGHGVCVVDPHGDLIEDLLTRIPPHRAADVILFDPSDSSRPIGLNLLEHHSETEKHLIVNEFLAMLMRMYDPSQMGIVGPRFQHNVRNAMLTAMSVPGSTLIEVVRVLSDSKFMQQMLPHVKDPLVRSYWVDQIAQTSDFHKSEILDYIVSKFNPFVGDRRVRQIIGQQNTTIDFRRVMDDRKILLVNLCKGKIGAENAQFLGLLLVQRLLMTALSRADMPEDRRPDFMLYVDEFQNFATKTFGTILSEGRKYGVAATVANQYLTQLEPPVREAIFGNVGTIVSFRMGTQDAVTLAPEMYPVFTADDLINLPKYTACIKMLVDGMAARPFTMRTLLDMRLPDRKQANAIREASRNKYGRDADAIDADIRARYRRE